MRAPHVGIVVLIAAIGLGFFVRAEDKPAAKNTAKSPGFEKIKSLSGDWDVTKAPGEHGHHGTSVTYKVTAAGSAVMETMFGGTEHEMITLFYVEGDDLAMTHYCMLQNRPHMRAERTSKPDKLVFKCKDGEDPKLDAEEHMHQVTYTFQDADHMKAEWILYKAGKKDSEHTFEFARKKK